MFVVIAFLGTLIAAMGLWGFILPNSFMDMMQRFARLPKGLYWIIGSRLLVGCLLLISAPLSRYPTLFYVVGVLSLFGALVTLMLGTENVERYMDWWAQRPVIYLRLIMLLGWLMGVVVVYVAIASL